MLVGAGLFPASGGSGGAQLTSASFSDYRSGLSSASCGLTFSRNGTLTNTNSAGNVALTNWWLPTTSTIGDSYEVKCTLSSGTFSTGTSGTWQTISTDRAFTVAVSSSGFVKAATFNADIRRISDSVVVASATFTIEADTTF
jgi:hypothetical protein